MNGNHRISQKQMDPLIIFLYGYLPMHATVKDMY